MIGILLCLNSARSQSVAQCCGSNSVLSQKCYTVCDNQCTVEYCKQYGMELDLSFHHHGAGRRSLQQECPTSTIVDLYLDTRQGGDVVTGCCANDLNRGAGGDDIYLHAVPNDGDRWDTAVSDLRLTNTGCPRGWTKVVGCCDGGDLNNNAGGDDIFLCMEQDSGIGSYVTDLYITESRSCRSGYQKPPGARDGGDLNNEAGGKDIFLCMKKTSCEVPDVNIDCSSVTCEGHTNDLSGATVTIEVSAMECGCKSECCKASSSTLSMILGFLAMLAVFA